MKTEAFLFSHPKIRIQSWAPLGGPQSRSFMRPQVVVGIIWRLVPCTAVPQPCEDWDNVGISISRCFLHVVYVVWQLQGSWTSYLEKRCVKDTRPGERTPSSLRSYAASRSPPPFHLWGSPKGASRFKKEKQTPPLNRMRHMVANFWKIQFQSTHWTKQFLPFPRMKYSHSSCKLQSRLFSAHQAQTQSPHLIVLVRPRLPGSSGGQLFQDAPFCPKTGSLLLAVSRPCRDGCRCSWLEMESLGGTQ